LRLVEISSGRVRINEDDRGMNEYWRLMLEEYEKVLGHEKHNMD